jgi:sulfite reductase (NADPH) flavoprotein alpha-component
MNAPPPDAVAIAPELDALHRLLDSLLHGPARNAATNPSGGLLDAGQWAAVERLGAALDRAQAHWVSGYFAGVAAVHASEHPARVASAHVLTILYGSETGHGAALAARLAQAAQARGLAATLVDMRDYKTRRLQDERTLLIVTATHGEGDPPQPARDFFEFVEGRKAPRLPDLRYGVLALGDQSYEHFCAAGRRLDERLAALGAQRLSARLDCDVDYEVAAQAWIDEMVARLENELAHAALAAVPAHGRAADPSEPAHPPAAPQDREIRVPAYRREHPFRATVVENLVLAGRGSTRETRHIELSLAGSGLAYAPGDALGIVSQNDPAVVEALLEALHLHEAALVDVAGRVTTLGEALTHDCEITLATPRFLEHWDALSGGKPAFAGMSAAERRAFARTHHIVDIVRRYRLPQVEAQAFVAGLRPLQPRLYSIASSAQAAPEEAHLTVAPVRYTMHGERRSGVMSGLLADRAGIDATLPVYIHRNPHFRLPDDDRPIVMVGAGTGVAPYRAFMQERETRGGGGRSWLFFGERNFRTDFLYQAEWQGWLEDGVLSRMDVAFSRDRAQKVYVQHRLRARGAEVWQWLDAGANLYVCGDAARLAPDVHAALVDIVEHHAGLDREDAAEYLGEMQCEGRYQRDVYGWTAPATSAAAMRLATLRPRPR